MTASSWAGTSCLSCLAHRKMHMPFQGYQHCLKLLLKHVQALLSTVCATVAARMAHKALHGLPTMLQLLHNSLNYILHLQVEHVPMQQLAALPGAAGRAASVQPYKQHPCKLTTRTLLPELTEVRESPTCSQASVWTQPTTRCNTMVPTHQALQGLRTSGSTGSPLKTVSAGCLTYCLHLCRLGFGNRYPSTLESMQQ
jgi:hypothetical protein